MTKLEDNEGLEFTAEVDVKPEITLPAYDGLEAKVEDIEVTDADVEEQVEALRERFAHPAATSSGPPPTATSSSSTSRPPRTARSSTAPS